MGSRKVISALAILWALGLCVGTAIRVKLGSSVGTTGFRHSALHFIAFAIFGFLLSKASSSVRMCILLAAAGIVVGFYTELYEHIVGGSDLEIVDIVNDAVGVLIGVGLQQVLQAKRSAPSSEAQSSL